MADRKTLANIKRKSARGTISNFEQLKTRVNKEWKKTTPNDCKRMIDDIPKKLSDVIKNGGEQICTR